MATALNLLEIIRFIVKDYERRNNSLFQCRCFTAVELFIVQVLALMAKALNLLEILRL
jgi:hypothetical protein